MNGLGAFARVPFLNRAVVLESGITASPGAFGDLLQQRVGVLLLKRLAAGDRTGPPVPALDGRLHELVADAHRKIFVLVHDAAIGLAVIGAVIALFDQRPGLFLFLLLGVDELFDFP